MRILPARVLNLFLIFGLVFLLFGAIVLRVLILTGHASIMVGETTQFGVVVHFYAIQLLNHAVSIALA